MLLSLNLKSHGPRCYSSDGSPFSLSCHRMEDSGEAMTHLCNFCPEHENIFSMTYLRKLFLAVID